MKRSCKQACDTDSNAEGGAGDRLAQINDELRDKVDVDTPWLPLESNPEIFSTFGHQIGMPQHWGFVDIYGLDSDLLAMAGSGRVAAVILLFPCSGAIYAARRAEERVLRKGGCFSDSGPRPYGDAFFLVQHAAFGNACGTIAAVHAISNARAAFGGFEGVSKSRNEATSPLASFCDDNADATPSERGHALLKAEALKGCSDGQARATAAQTTCPDRHGPDLDHHFVAFSSLNGRLVELDGTKLSAIDHGPAPEDGQGFLQAAAATIQKCFMDIDPGNIEFSLMALCEGGTEGRSSVEGSNKQQAASSK
jgi:ubiquitin carboxyl-terminal hydrolase L3